MRRIERLSPPRRLRLKRLLRVPGAVVGLSLVLLVLTTALLALTIVPGGARSSRWDPHCRRPHSHTRWGRTTLDATCSPVWRRGPDHAAGGGRGGRDLLDDRRRRRCHLGFSRRPRRRPPDACDGGRADRSALLPGGGGRTLRSRPRPAHPAPRAQLMADAGPRGAGAGALPEAAGVRRGRPLAGRLGPPDPPARRAPERRPHGGGGDLAHRRHRDPARGGPS